jgi:hypothetical protein
LIGYSANFRRRDEQRTRQPTDRQPRHHHRRADPAFIADAGDHAARRFVEFFTATIRNPNTRRAYARAAGDFFGWCQEHSLTLPDIEPVLSQNPGHVRGPR